MHKILICVLALLVCIAAPERLLAQQSTFVQIEAVPTLREAQGRARAYSASFNAVNGLRMRSGWYAIALGPYTEAQAASERLRLLQSGLIPADSYLTQSTQYTQAFWPIGAAALPVAPIAAPPTPATPAIALPQTPPADETPAEARRSERALTRAEREAIQEALKWEGVYTTAIDGSFGPGTRRAMGAYQIAQGFEATGVLTTAQRLDLLQGYRDALASLGMVASDDTQAGIRMQIPAAMVARTSVEAPFVRYDNTDGSGTRVLLISQSGDQNTLSGLYNILQTLEIVPPNGAREFGRTSFTLTGQNETLHSYTYVALSNGQIKGFMLLSAPENAKLMDKAAQIMRDSFAPYTQSVLPDDAGSSAQNIDLLAGLEIRRPELSRSGFYIDAGGSVLTTTEIASQCARITIGDELEADITARDDALGLAILKPRSGLAPIAIATFRNTPPRLQSEVAMAGFSYGDTLDAPVISYGTVADTRGLSGESNVNRLALEALPGDAGGPVLDASGAVIGPLLPRADGNRQLPADVNFLAAFGATSQFLQDAGIQISAAQNTGALDPVDLSVLASDMTVRVSCWN